MHLEDEKLIYMDSHMDFRLSHFSPSTSLQMLELIQIQTQLKVFYIKIFLFVF